MLPAELACLLSRTAQHLLFARRSRVCVNEDKKGQKPMGGGGGVELNGFLCDWAPTAA